MQKTLAKLGFCVVVAALTLGQAQCPQGPPPPFDATGLYIGTWSGQTTATEKQSEQIVTACPLTMTLVQNVNAPYPANHGVSGTVEIDYSCLTLPEWVQQTPPPSIANVSGLLTDEGTLTLFSGGCGPGVCVVLTLAGEGTVADADGMMDAYSGAWSFIILLAGVQPFGVSGTFEVERSLEE